MDGWMGSMGERCEKLCMLVRRQVDDGGLALRGRWN